MKRIQAVFVLCMALTHCLARDASGQEASSDTVKFNFDWPQGLSARVEMVNLTSQSSQAGTVEASGALRYELKVAPQDDKLRVTVDKIEFLDAGKSGKQGLGDVTLIGAVVPAYLVTRKGEYSGIDDPKGTRDYLRAGLMTALPANLTREGREAAERAMDTLLSEAMLEQFVGDQWNMMVGFWIDSEPELRETYEDSTDEPSAVAPGATVRMNLEFQVLRRLPCLRGGQQRQCVETTMISTVDPEGGRKLTSQFLSQMNSALGSDPLKDASLLLVRRTNLITEPEGMVPHSYVHEELVTLKMGANAKSVSRTKKRTVTFTYD